MNDVSQVMLFDNWFPIKVDKAEIKNIDPSYG